MTRLSLFERLHPELRSKLDKELVNYPSVKYLFDKLKATEFYSDLTIEDVRSLTTFGDINCMQMSPWDWRYGDVFFTEEKYAE